MNSSNWQIGKTQSTTPPAIYKELDEVFSFSIQNHHGAPLVTISYPTKAESEQAEAAVKKAIQFAIDISVHKS